MKLPTAFYLICRALYAVERLSAFHPPIVDALQNQITSAFIRWAANGIFSPSLFLSVALFPIFIQV